MLYVYNQLSKPAMVHDPLSLYIFHDSIGHIHMLFLLDDFFVMWVSILVRINNMSA